MALYLRQIVVRQIEVVEALYLRLIVVRQIEVVDHVKNSLEMEIQDLFQDTLKHPGSLDRDYRIARIRIKMTDI